MVLHLNEFERRRTGHFDLSVFLLLKWDLSYQIMLNRSPFKKTLVSAQMQSVTKVVVRIVTMFEQKNKKREKKGEKREKMCEFFFLE